MPNLINILRPAEVSERKGKRKSRIVSEEERKRELARVLGGKAQDDEGMEWGTCMVFSCLSNCCKDGEKYGWFEEEVLVQWEE